jgi:hypothetical protein
LKSRSPDGSYFPIAPNGFVYHFRKLFAKTQSPQRIQCRTTPALNAPEPILFVAQHQTGSRQSHAKFSAWQSVAVNFQPVEKPDCLTLDSDDFIHSVALPMN